jgi:wyosine [tRNA(Phe)-imidazoG37] synthetase (radical SAM superfamily)
VAGLNDATIRPVWIMEPATDKMMKNRLVFGPVPSRRLGRSLGINHIPPKICTYSCVYCQLGRTRQMEVETRTFYNPEDIKKAVIEKIESAGRADEPVDYLTFVPNGEPTLDAHLGETIALLKSVTGKKIAIITNASLLWQNHIREALKQADRISIKVDSLQQDVWRKINRPHHSLQHDQILNGIITFSKEYQGTMVTETMLLRNLNDSECQVRDLADFIKQLAIETAYLSVPTRPPAEKWAHTPTDQTLIQAHEIMRAAVLNVEYLIAYEGNHFAFTGNVESDILSITSVHPMREEAVNEFLKRAETGWHAVEGMIERQLLVRQKYNGKYFYIRKLNPSQIK